MQTALGSIPVGLLLCIFWALCYEKAMDRWINRETQIEPVRQALIDWLELVLNQPAKQLHPASSQPPAISNRLNSHFKFKHKKKAPTTMAIHKQSTSSSYLTVHQPSLVLTYNQQMTVHLSNPYNKRIQHTLGLTN